MAVTVIVTVIAAYLIGSINFAVIFAKAFMKKDVRELGSGNAGTTNVMRNAGFLPGALTFVFDALKGFVASYMGKIVFDYIYSQTNNEWSNAIVGAFLCGFACMVGHVFPFFFEFKGGKGVATSVGIFAVCCPLAIVIGLTVFAILLFTSKYVSLSSILAAVTVVVLTIILCDKTIAVFPQIALSIGMGAIVIGKHSDNIKRLIAGTESKVKFGGK
ncbi:MAG: glycerol-3-phosphate 1-O-acyltransferase PlsY [Clostridia bacterium]|nr:glycerol-3-phosphate 1-O-acyltransferase PlsY [Clostridia bacterium]